MPTYTPRPLSAEENADAIRAAARITTNRSTAQIRMAVLALCAANIQLAAEINEHREARGFAPLPTYKP